MVHLWMATSENGMNLFKVNNKKNRMQLLYIFLDLIVTFNKSKMLKIITAYWPILAECSISIPPDNVRKTKVF